MQHIADWLEKLGLGQCAPRFAENDINFAILSDLTDQDLKELGVSSLGHRRQLLRAIAGLNSVEKGAPKLAPATAAPVTAGAARPARPRQGGGADRSGDRPGVLARLAGFRGSQFRGGAGSALDRLIQAGLLAASTKR